MSNSNKKEKELYLLFISELNVCKIGISNSTEKRVKQLQTGCPYKIDVVKKYRSDMSSKIEKVIHRKYSHLKTDYNQYHLRGEWFYIDLQDVIYFERTCQEIENTIINLKNSGNPFI